MGLRVGLGTVVMSWRGFEVMGWCNGERLTGPGTGLERGPLLSVWWASAWSKQDNSWSISLISSSKSLVGGDFRLLSKLEFEFDLVCRAPDFSGLDILESVALKVDRGGGVGTEALSVAVGGG